MRLLYAKNKDKGAFIIIYGGWEKKHHRVYES